MTLIGFRAAAILASGCSASTPAATPLASVPRLSNVVVLIFENTPARTALANPQFAALARSGARLDQYFAIAHNSLPNYLALVAGVQPTAKTKADCLNFDCQVASRTLPEQLDAAHVVWSGYLGGTNQPCHAPMANQPDPYQSGYITHHNPFAYLPSVGADANIGSDYCRAHLHTLGSAADAQKAALRGFTLVVPDSCDDGHDRPCTVGRPGGMATAGSFAQQFAAALTASPTWDSRSLLVITFDEADPGDPRNCCHSPGGGRVATIMISPLISPGTVSSTPYSHYGLLRTIEDAYGISTHLGQAADPRYKAITDVWRR